MRAGGADPDVAVQHVGAAEDELGRLLLDDGGLAELDLVVKDNTLLVSGKVEQFGGRRTIPHRAT